MYIATVPNRNSPPAILLRESYREDGKVKNGRSRTSAIGNRNGIDALGRALKGEFDGLSGAPQSGEIFGVLFALKRLADEVGITAALGQSKRLPWRSSWSWPASPTAALGGALG